MVKTKIDFGALNVLFHTLVFGLVRRSCSLFLFGWWANHMYIKVKFWCEKVNRELS